MSRVLRACLAVLALCSSGFLILKAAEMPIAQPRPKAAELEKAGNFKEAYDLYEKLLLDPAATGQVVADDLLAASRCLQNLQRTGEIDPLLGKVVELHAANPIVLWRAAKILADGTHYGYLTAGQFTRGDARGGGMFVDVSERDRVQSLRWLNTVREQIPESWTATQKSDFYRDFANILFQNRSWKLQILTDLAQLPDYPTVEESSGRGRRFGWRPQPQGAPVDEAGNPIFYKVPADFDAAQNDGERWRWCLQQVVEYQPDRLVETQLEFAAFLNEQFGVQTLARWGGSLPRSEEKNDTQSALWSLPSLNENETIAYLANGVKRFTLPDEFNPIRIYRDVVQAQGTPSATINALTALGRIFQDRQQYEKAAGFVRDLTQRQTGSSQESAQKWLNQIVGNWGQFEPNMSQPAGRGATLEYRFRNGNSVTFEATRLKVPELISDIKTYLKSQPKQFDWEKIQIDDIGARIVQKNENRYLGEKVATWTLPLEPRAGHNDRRVTVTTPLQKGGAYLVTARMANGNTSRIVVWLNDTAIIKKQLNNKVLYYVADAVTGAPANHAKVEFFNWTQNYDQQGRSSRISFNEFAEFTSADGFITLTNKLQSNNYQTLAVARTEQGGFAFLGFSSLWFTDRNEYDYQETKVYVITDRPVYRPDQKVEFKFWVREARYDHPDRTRFAGASFTVTLNDPQGTEIDKKTFTTDEFGGISGSFPLPKQAALGTYQLLLSGNPDGRQQIVGTNSFGVEEYKKPEFEVTVDAPKEPVQLGDKITATIRAKYYYGAPVAQGTAKIKVERSQHDARWFPVDSWDWLYGNGYWWFTPETTWYPGFGKWGCLTPSPLWRPWSADPPELVLDREVPIAADGTISIEIDTALAKLLHGDQDHEYSVTAEVTDASRRTIVGKGNVLVSREPFKVFSWTDRGYYQVGDTIQASFQARTLSGNGVEGTGTLRLLKVRYEDGKPVEETAQEWELNTNTDGFASQTLKASQPGQYRLSYKLKSKANGVELEGGQLFVIRGEGFDGSQFQFNDLEIIANQKTYQPGDKVKLLLNTNRLGSTVLLFVRPVGGVAAGAPQVLRLKGKSTQVEIDVLQKDMPNFFVEAVTMANGKLHQQVKEVVVPPESRVLNVEVKPSAESYLPGAKAEVDVKVTGPDGKPFQGSLVLSVYDRAVEYISGGSNVTDIREFFWKWRRHHNPQAESNLAQRFDQLLKQGEIAMSDLGVFGGSVADRDDQRNLRAGGPMGRRGNARSGGEFWSQLQDVENAAAPSFGSFDPAIPMAMKAGGMGGQPGEEAEEVVVPVVRTNFADTAFWKADLLTDAEGLARVTFDMPENLSAWKMRAWGMGADTNVGEGTAEAVTRKNIIVRLQAPRFFIETDEVVLSANVHNDLDVEKQVQVELLLEGETLKWLADFRGDPRYSPMTTTVTIPAHGETRVDWRVKAVQPGTASITMKALTDVESDAMQMSFPVSVHGILKTESYSNVIRPDAENTTIKFTVPEQRIPEQSRLEVRYSPTLAGALVDALPYLAEYPYGCTEQTLNRFLPTVITQKILLEMGLDLQAIQEKRTNLNSQQIGDDAERAKQWKRFDRNPVFDADEVAAMVKQGVQDLTAMQCSDGGWGWFSGYGEHSTPHTTAVVVHGLQLAWHNDIAITHGVLENGIAWLKNYQTRQVELLLEGERHEKDPNRKQAYKTAASNIDALIFTVLVDEQVHDAEMQRFLYRDRLSLSPYSQALLGIALHDLQAIEQRDMVIRNLDQFIKVDDENQTAYFDLPNQSYWWSWYGNTIEANAQYLRLLTKVNPNDPKAAGLVKYLINNRRHGTYWNNTRDTAYCIEALADYLHATKEMQTNVQVEVWLDGELKQTVEITPATLFTFDNSFVLEGSALTAGEHTLELRRRPLGVASSPQANLYVNAYVTNFTKEDPITATGLEIKVGRKFYKLTQDKTATTDVAGSRGQALNQSVIKYDRTELNNLDRLESGDLIEVELEIDSKNDYEYVLFEDYKAAGFEPVDLQSGYTAGGLGAYVEFRDEKVAFFLKSLARGKHSVSYRLRAEIPGKFSALPTMASGMYAPELKANANELKLLIEDRPVHSAGSAN
ncbi:alpha-2-macroglobulin family protein [Planctomicrobium sp. SH664]|uniref:alpha-2-macroglobulin family protein n=1 Tax=Planctomicrobium sp. SH664 TaxID=3448125 RepID=UPI003F5BC1F4